VSSLFISRLGKRSTPSLSERIYNCIGKLGRASTHQIITLCSSYVPVSAAFRRYIKWHLQKNWPFSYNVSKQAAYGSMLVVITTISGMRRQGLVRRTGERDGRASIWEIVPEDEIETTKEIALKNQKKNKRSKK
jgi:hypothetical protein